MKTLLTRLKNARKHYVGGEFIGCQVMISDDEKAFLIHATKELGDEWTKRQKKERDKARKAEMEKAGKAETKDTADSEKKSSE